MCSLTLALTGLTTGLSMASTYQQSRAQAAAYNAQAEAAMAQAQAAKQQADTAYQNAKIQNRKGEQVAEQYVQQQRQMDARRKLILGQQTAAAGAAGLASGIGSSLDMYIATNNAWEEDSTNLLENQRNAIYDNYVQEVNLRNQGNVYIAQSHNLESQADSYRQQASAAKTAGNWSMFGTLLGGATSMIGAGSSGGSSASAGGKAQMPTAAGYYDSASDAAFAGLSGYTPKTTGVYQGMYNSFGPQKKTKGFSIF